MQGKTLYDTSNLPPGERFAYWREAVCESYVQLGCYSDSRRDFSGRIKISRHSHLSVSEVFGKEHLVQRRKRDIISATEEYFLLSLQLNQTSKISQFGMTSLLRPGDMALYDSSNPYTLELSEGFSQIVLQLPKELLLARLPHARLLTAQRIDGQKEIGKLVFNNIISFTQQLGSNNTIQESLVQDTLIDLIATGLATGKQQNLQLSSPEQQILLRVKNYICSNLSDPELDRNRVAAQAGLSVRRLNAIFSKEGCSIAEFIRRQRLARVAEQLRSPRCTALSISEIAFRNGFSNLQHFSTMFRNYYDMSPKAWRSTLNHSID